MSELLKDPLLYINYGAAIVGCYLMWKFAPLIMDPKTPPLRGLVFFVGLALMITALLYISYDAGTHSLIKLGIAP